MHTHTHTHTHYTSADCSHNIDKADNNIIIISTRPKAVVTGGSAVVYGDVGGLRLKSPVRRTMSKVLARYQTGSVEIIR